MVKCSFYSFCLILAKNNKNGCLKTAFNKKAVKQVKFTIFT